MQGCGLSYSLALAEFHKELQNMNYTRVFLTLKERVQPFETPCQFIDDYGFLQGVGEDIASLDMQLPAKHNSWRREQL